MFMACMTKTTTEISKMILKKFYDSGKAKIPISIFFKLSSGAPLVEIQKTALHQASKLSEYCFIQIPINFYVYTYRYKLFSSKKQYVQVILALEFFLKNESTMSRIRVFSSLSWFALSSKIWCWLTGW